MLLTCSKMPEQTKNWQWHVKAHYNELFHRLALKKYIYKVARYKECIMIRMNRRLQVFVYSWLFLCYNMVITSLSVFDSVVTYYTLKTLKSRERERERVREAKILNIFARQAQ